MRRLLTEEFVDSLSMPSQGEIWIADTKVRGFGLRLWATKSKVGIAYGIRTSVRGRKIRKAYVPDAIKFVSGKKVLTFKRHVGNPLLSSDQQIQASIYLEEAREWARVEVARAKGRIPAEITLLKSIEAEKRHRKRMSTRLKKHKLGFLIEKILEYGSCRGWNESYCDRLRQAFNSFDKCNGASKLTAAELSNGRLEQLIVEAPIGHGTLRLLKSILKPVVWNLHYLTDLRVYDTFRNEGRNLSPQPKHEEIILSRLQLHDFDALLKALPELKHDWRSVLCIALCFQFSAPIRKVMSGSWSQLKDARWIPYKPDERKNWYWNWHRIEQREFELLQIIRQNIIKEKIDSDFWFPSLSDPGRPISNVDRAWTRLLQEVEFPSVSLSCCTRAYQAARPLQIPWLWHNVESQRRHHIERTVAEWKRPFKARKQFR